MKTGFPQTHAKGRKIAVSNYESPALTAELFTIIFCCRLTFSSMPVALTSELFAAR